MSTFFQLKVLKILNNHKFYWKEPIFTRKRKYFHNLDKRGKRS